MNASLWSYSLNFVACSHDLLGLLYMQCVIRISCAQSVNRQIMHAFQI